MRALTLLGLLGLVGCALPPRTPPEGRRHEEPSLKRRVDRSGALFVDQVEDGHAVLLDESGGVHRVPASALPADAGEGSWIGDPPLPDPRIRIAALRRKLAEHDDGQDIALH